MTLDVAPPGFFGKLPTRGDFLVRRVPSEFRDAWETWLAGLVVAARDALGANWPNDWLTAPLWHFSLGRDMVGPAGAAGVVLASVDRVGRFFPFSIIGPAAVQANSGRDAWARSVEALALAALEDDFNPDELDAALQSLGPPPSAGGVTRETGQWPLALEDEWPSATADVLAESTWQPPGPGQSAWWCRGSDRMQPLHLRCRGLPDDGLSTALITGGFT